MQKSLDPMSVEKTETPSASVVLRRRYGRTRFAIVAASWITVLNMFLQPLAALAGTFSSTQTGNYNADATWGVASNPGGGAGNDIVSVFNAVTIVLANDASTDTVTVNTGGTLALNPAAGALTGGTVVLNGGILSATFPWLGNNIGGTVQIADNSTVNVNNTNRSNAQAAILGPLSFTGANKTLESTTPYGPASTQADVAQFSSLALGSNNAEIKTTSLNVNIGGSLTANSGTTLTKTGTWALSLNGAATWTGAGGVIANAGTTYYNFANSLGTTTGNQINNTAVGDAYVASSIAGAIVQVNAGGTLQASATDALKDGTVVLNGGTLYLRSLTWNGWEGGAYTRGGTIQVADSSTVNFNNTNRSNAQAAIFGALSFTGANKTLVVITPYPASTQADAVRFTSLAVNAGGSTLQVSSAYNTVTISGSITGTGTLAKEGAGTLTASAASDAFTGAVRVNAGTFTQSDNLTVGTVVVNGGTYTPASSKTLKGFVYNSGTFTLPGTALTLATAANGGYIGGTGIITSGMLGTLTNNGSGLYGGDPTGALNSTGKLGTLTVTPTTTYVLANNGTIYFNIAGTGDVTGTDRGLINISGGSSSPNFTAGANANVVAYNPNNLSLAGTTYTFLTHAGTFAGTTTWNGKIVNTTSTTINWTEPGGSDHLWITGTNWDLSGYQVTVNTATAGQIKLVTGSATNYAPVPTSDVIIDKSASITGPTGATSIVSLILGDTGGTYSPTLTLQTGGNLTVSGNVVINAGSTLTATDAALTGASMTVNGAATIGTGSTISGIVTVNTGGTFNASAGTIGTLNVTGGTVGNTALAATIATANFTGGNSTITGGSITGVTTLNAATGSLAINGGTLTDFRISSTDAVNPTIASGATLTNATIDGSGLGGATVTLGNTTAMTGTLTINGTSTVVSRPSGNVATLAVNAGTLGMNTDVTTAATFAGGTSTFTGTTRSIQIATVNNSGATVNFNATTTNIPDATTGLNVSAGSVVFANTPTAGTIAKMTLSGGSVALSNQTVTSAAVSGTGALSFAVGSTASIPTLTYGSTAGAGLTVPSTASVGSGAGGVSVSNGTVNFNNTNAMTILTVTGGTTTIGPAVSGNLVKVATADFSAGTGTVNAANPLAITSTLKLSGGITGTYTPGSGPAYFTASNPASGDIVADTNRTLTLSGGKLQLAKQSGTDVITTFTYTGSSASFIVPTSLTAKVLVVAGGGGGGKGEGGAQGDAAGGGGAGGLIYNGAKDFSAGTYSIYVGNGGAGSTSNPLRGANGEDSYIQLGGEDVFRAIGGGGGGSDNYTAINQGADGGSGGGAASSHNQTWSGGSMRVGQGNAGGSTSWRSGQNWGPRGGAGGGGAGSAGTSEAAGDPEWRGKKGGDGLLYPISGSSVPYAGGGGGGNCRDTNGTPGDGGLGGGGKGGAEAGNGENGTANTGGGGGGSGGGGTGGNGGSGIVIVSYNDFVAINLPNTAIAATAGSTPTLDLGASDKNHTLGNVTVTAGAGANTTLTVDKVNSLTIGTLTIGINGAYYGKLDLGTKGLTLGNGSVTKLAVTAESSAVGGICVAVAANNSFTGLNGTEVTDNNNKKWTVAVVDVGDGKDELRLTPPARGTIIMFK